MNHYFSDHSTLVFELFYEYLLRDEVDIEKKIRYQKENNQISYLMELWRVAKDLVQPYLELQIQYLNYLFLMKENGSKKRKQKRISSP